MGVPRPGFTLCSGRDEPCWPSGLWDRGSKRRQVGQGTEAGAPGRDRERMQGNASSHGCCHRCRQWDCWRAGGGDGGGGARWEQILAGLHSYCGCLGVLATGQVNRLGTLPPWRVRKEPGPGHCTTSASAGQEDDLGLSNGLATLPVPASHPAC